MRKKSEINNSNKMEIKNYEIHISLFIAHVHTHISIMRPQYGDAWYREILFKTQPSLLYNGEETILFGQNVLQ